MTTAAISSGPDVHHIDAPPHRRWSLLLASVAGGLLLSLATFVQPAAADFTLLGVTNAAGGTDSTNPIVYRIRINCIGDPSASSVDLENAAQVGTWYAFYVERDSTASANTCDVDGYEPMSGLFLSTAAGGSLSVFSGVQASTYAIPAEVDGPRPLNTGESAAVAFQMPGGVPGVSLTLSFGPGPATVDFFITTGGGGGGSSSSSSASDPRAETVSVVAEQVAAAGVQGAASGVRVRDGEVLPVTTRVSSTVGPRGGVVLDSDGMQVRVASVLGARADAGVIVPSNGVFEASVTGPLVPGSVVEVWINSEPRLVAAGEVSEDGDVTIAIPTGTPLDGGDPIEDGEHTLELRMFTEDGYEIVATGITVGQVAPTRVPAGEGPAPLGGALPLLAGVLLVAAVAGRRVLVRG